MLLILMFLQGPSARAQGLREIPAALRSALKTGNKENTRLNIKVVTRQNRKDRHNGVVVRPDSVLYRHIVRRHSWFEGLGDTLTQAEADSLPLYFKLSVKSPAGHWQHVEAMQREQLTTEHGIQTYLLNHKNAYGPEVNQTWMERLRSVCQWYFYSDPKGERVFEERAYDRDGNMMYSFTPVPAEDGSVVGTYTDALGMPAEIIEDSTIYYGMVVRVAYDSHGLDSLVQYMDGAGYVRPNADGVYVIKYQYDREGRGYLSSKTFLNPVGFPMNNHEGFSTVNYRQDEWGYTFAVDSLDRFLQKIDHHE